jgi:hypothetical protein
MPGQPQGYAAGTPSALTAGCRARLCVRSSRTFPCEGGRAVLQRSERTWRLRSADFDPVLPSCRSGAWLGAPCQGRTGLAPRPTALRTPCVEAETRPRAVPVAACAVREPCWQRVEGGPLRRPTLRVRRLRPGCGGPGAGQGPERVCALACRPQGAAQQRRLAENPSCGLRHQRQGLRLISPTSGAVGRTGMS